MLPRAAVSHRACGEGRQSSGGHRESAQWEQSWLSFLRQREAGKGEPGQRAAPTASTEGSRRHAQQGQFSSMETGLGAALILTSHIQVGGGRVASACRVGRHTLVLALVRLLAALNLQGTCGDTATEIRPGLWGGVSTAFGLVLTRG